MPQSISYIMLPEEYPAKPDPPPVLTDPDPAATRSRSGNIQIHFCRIHHLAPVKRQVPGSIQALAKGSRHKKKSVLIHVVSVYDQ